MSHLPPITLEAPLKTFVRLLTKISAYGNTLTFTKFPMVSSMTMRKSYLSASARRRGRWAERSRGLEGNSVKRARMGGVVGSRAASASRIFSSSSMSLSVPKPRKWHPGPHFSRILRVSVYGNLYQERKYEILAECILVYIPKTYALRWGPRRSRCSMCIPDRRHAGRKEVYIVRCHGADSTDAGSHHELLLFRTRLVGAVPEQNTRHARPECAFRKRGGLQRKVSPVPLF
jgi:hypothetical protein